MTDNNNLLDPNDYTFVNTEQQPGLGDWVELFSGNNFDTGFFQEYIDYANSGITPTSQNDLSWVSSMENVDPLVASVRGLFDDLNSWQYDEGTRFLYTHDQAGLDRAFEMPEYADILNNLEIIPQGQWHQYNPSLYSMPASAGIMVREHDPTYNYIDKDPFLELAQFIVDQNPVTGETPLDKYYRGDFSELDQLYGPIWEQIFAENYSPVYTPEGGYVTEAERQQQNEQAKALEQYQQAQAALDAYYDNPTGYTPTASWAYNELSQLTDRNQREVERSLDSASLHLPQQAAIRQAEADLAAQGWDLSDRSYRGSEEFNSLVDQYWDPLEPYQALIDKFFPTDADKISVLTDNQQQRYNDALAWLGAPPTTEELIAQNSRTPEEQLAYLQSRLNRAYSGTAEGIAAAEEAQVARQQELEQQLASAQTAYDAQRTGLESQLSELQAQYDAFMENPVGRPMTEEEQAAALERQVQSAQRQVDNFTAKLEDPELSDRRRAYYENRLAGAQEKVENPTLYSTEYNAEKVQQEYETQLERLQNQLSRLAPKEVERAQSELDRFISKQQDQHDRGGPGAGQAGGPHSEQFDPAEQAQRELELLAEALNKYGEDAELYKNPDYRDLTQYLSGGSGHARSPQRSDAEQQADYFVTEDEIPVDYKDIVSELYSMLPEEQQYQPSYTDEEKAAAQAYLDEQVAFLEAQMAPIKEAYELARTSEREMELLLMPNHLDDQYTAQIAAGEITADEVLPIPEGMEEAVRLVAQHYWADYGGENALNDMRLRKEIIRQTPWLINSEAERTQSFSDNTQDLHDMFHGIYQDRLGDLFTELAPYLQEASAKLSADDSALRSTYGVAQAFNEMQTMLNSGWYGADQHKPVNGDMERLMSHITHAARDPRIWGGEEGFALFAESGIFGDLQAMGFEDEAALEQYLLNVANNNPSIYWDGILNLPLWEAEDAAENYGALHDYLFNIYNSQGAQRAIDTLNERGINPVTMAEQFGYYDEDNNWISPATALRQQYTPIQQEISALKNEFRQQYGNVNTPWNLPEWQEANPELAAQFNELLQANKTANYLEKHDELPAPPAPEENWTSGILQGPNALAIPNDVYEEFVQALRGIPSELAGLSLKELGVYGPDMEDRAWTSPDTGYYLFDEQNFAARINPDIRGTVNTIYNPYDEENWEQYNFGINTGDSKYDPALLEMIFGVPAGWTPETMTPDELGIVGSSPLYPTDQTLYGGQVNQDPFAALFSPMAQGINQYLAEDIQTPMEFTEMLRSKAGLEGDPNAVDPVFMPYWQENSPYLRDQLAAIQNWQEIGSPDGDYYVYLDYFDQRQQPEEYMNLMKEHGVEADIYGNKGWILPGGVDQLDQIIRQTYGDDALSASSTDVPMVTNPTEHKYLIEEIEEKGFWDSFGPVLGLVGGMVGGPIGAAMKFGSALATGNPIGAVLSGFNMANGFGWTDFNPMGAINDALNNIDLPSFDMPDFGGIDLGQVPLDDMLMSGVIGAMQGQDFLSSALMGGANELFGDVLGGIFGEGGSSGLNFDADQMRWLNTAMKLGTNVYGAIQREGAYEDFMEQMNALQNAQMNGQDTQQPPAQDTQQPPAQDTQQDQQDTGENTTPSSENDAIIDDVELSLGQRARDAVNDSLARGMPNDPYHIARAAAQAVSDDPAEIQRVFQGILQMFYQQSLAQAQTA